MERKKLKQLLEQYKKCYPEESVKTLKTEMFLNRSKTCFSRNNWEGHFTGSAWVVDQSREWVLMTHHRQLDMWLQLGGHAEGRSNLLDVALDEAQEESGLSKLNVLSTNIFDLDIHKIPAFKGAPTHLHFDVRFIMEAEHGLENIIVSDESHDVAWINKNDVLHKNPEQSMARMLQKTLENFSI
ncbi:MAG: NUDIX hydrolase [Candidatus Marinimicrobia bacterium]|nr:NUDIX hydrolase [Candidatus Neomarinimicrobiota bacterium]MBT3676795.1 NUDIX hydrolase [Candidatus Neomarinimicrobiota bacterium]MBT3763789.1 NUDIX hydrolase [Candidatus Neomarinimicrobiota bacterium]MBT4069518.1 NUDIX hydrolase [Candidatus Neomarinimicrobiota bacterium]MBT4269940.1 NUDIX hydrolase [Candidatus Neomarinimicrobiota bacterium]